MNIYVGNLSYEVSDDQLREVFEAYGTVSSAKVISENTLADPKVLIR